MDNTDYGRARIAPNTALAGQKGQWTIDYTVGKSGIAEGGGIRIITPRTGLDAWQIGKVLAFCDNPNAHFDITVEKTDPPTYHHSHYPAVDIVVYGTPLKSGEHIRVVMGAIGGYLSGRFVQAQAQTHTCRAPFEVFADPLGNAHFSREQTRDYAYHKVPGPLTVTVKPAAPAHIRCTLRNSPGEGRPAIAVIAVEDAYQNPISDTAFDIALFPEQGENTSPSQTVKTKRRAGVHVPIPSVGAGVSRLGASCWPHGIYGVSNPLHPDFFGPNLKVYFGDLHVMTGSHGNLRMDGTTESAIRYARDVFGLDFTAVTNGPNPKLWPHDRDLFKAYHKDHRFVTMPAYENGLSTGHKNVYFPSEPEQVRPARTAEDLWKVLKNTECMVISHHTNTPSETDPEKSWSHHQIDTINPRFERLVEICQNRGSFEKDEIGDEVTLGGFGSSIRDILARGLRLGFVGGTDSHRGRPGSPYSNQSGMDARAHITGGITGVLCKELTRQEIWNALLARRCYAATSTRILLDVTLNGLTMGRDFRLTKKNKNRFAERTIRIRAVGVRPLTRVVIVRNGQEVFEQALDQTECDLVWQDTERLGKIHDRHIRGAYYYAKVYQQDGNLAWSSPVWLSFTP